MRRDYRPYVVILEFDNIRHTTYNSSMIRTQVYLPDDLYRELKLLAQQKGTNFSALIRKGVKEVIKKKRRRRNKKWGEGFIGAYKGKVKTNAVKDIHDYYKNDAI